MGGKGSEGKGKGEGKGKEGSSEQDTLSSGFSEFNLNKKIRGAKKPNLFPILTREDAARLLHPIKITKRIAVSKISEFYDPVGLFEPMKLQHKLDMKRLDEDVPEADQQIWKDTLACFVSVLLIPFMY